VQTRMRSPATDINRARRTAVSSKGSGTPASSPWAEPAFPSETLARAVSLAGRRILWCWHRAQPRHHLWSLRVALDDRGWRRLARLTRVRVVYGVIVLASVNPSPGATAAAG